MDVLKRLPSVLPKVESLTLEKAIAYLHEIGWMQKHDKAMTESTWDNTVLEDIKAEIEKDSLSDVNGSKFIFVKRVNEIIDKYMGDKNVRKG